MSDQHRWDSRYAQEQGPEQPAALWSHARAFLPRVGTALDVAGGTGRHAFVLAQHGLRVTLLDVSAVAVDTVNQHARAHGLAVTAHQWDAAVAPLPEGRWDVVWCTFFHDVTVWGALASRVAPGGVLCVAHPTQRNLERNAHPSARWLGAPGEVAALAPGWERLWEFEGWTPGGTHEGQLVARAPR